MCIALRVVLCKPSELMKLPLLLTVSQSCQLLMHSNNDNDDDDDDDVPMVL